MEMRQQARDLHEDGGGDDEEEDLGTKRDASSQKDLIIKVDGKSSDQKANTPRSKHSATEQLRRSKINERFQILRDLLPPSDQKRDKASFLLEVIEYIQILHEKLTKYEGSYQGWDQEPIKYMRWRNSHLPGGSMIDHSRLTKNGSGPGLIFPGKLNDGSISVTPHTPENAQNPAEVEQRAGVPYKPMDPHGLADKALISDGEHIVAQPPADPWQNLTCTTDCPTNNTLSEPEDMAVEGGTISISSAYSQGLLNNLTQALQSTGVDLSQASMSVQIDLGKRAFNRQTCTTSSPKVATDHGDPSSSNQAATHSRVASSGEESDQTQKRLKTVSR